MIVACGNHQEEASGESIGRLLELSSGLRQTFKRKLWHECLPHLHCHAFPGWGARLKNQAGFVKKLLSKRREDMQGVPSCTCIGNIGTAWVAMQPEVLANNVLRFPEELLVKAESTNVHRHQPPRHQRSSLTHLTQSQPSRQQLKSHMTRVYLDYNATTPVEPAVLQALLPFLGPQFGNASSAYALGQTAKKAVATARAQVAAMLGAAAAEVVFLSGGTESINYAIKGSALAAKRDSSRSHIVTSCVEHVAVLETCKWLETQGFQVTYLPVDRFGCVRVQDVLDALTPQTCVVSIMLANNEVGSLQPVADISRAVRRFVEEEEDRLPILVHTDASQAIGKVRVNVQDLGVDLLTIAGHKLYAPKGVGALYIREGTVVDTIIHGASQESGRRGGTENVALVVALGQACALVEKNLHEYAVIMQESRTFLLEQIQKHCSLTNVSYQVNGHPELSLPNTLSISFENISAPRILDSDGVYASAGSACHSHKQDNSDNKQKNPESSEEHITISHVLAAMHVAPEFAKGTLRLSVGRSTTQEELLHAANAIHKAIQQLM
ncbi:unnamed protein product [Phytophthora lilii]|uniref:cysteine desulfurase n=1 Tax=Phytophthora lilii TaxID=2077276 RepID=A0A9W6TIA2_9STRA|nr:unnamed protein product [Phytophthora lilii]